jgi:CheY-like chemotaxis protein
MSEPPRAPGARVLIVDDEPDQVEMYSYALEDGGFRVAVAYTGDEAVDRARTLMPDVIVLDVRLPDMTGWDVCSILKTDPRTEHIPIVILTAMASPTLAQEAANAGCAAHLLKPCYPHELTNTVRSIVAAT